jgi:hAT family C-terminal dimerisation region
VLKHLYNRYYSPKWLEDHPNHVPPHMDNEISKMRNQYLRKLFPSTEQRRCVLDEFARFSICGGGFDEHDSIGDREGLEPINWWVVYGGAAPNIQALALKLLGQPSSSSCCERNWKTYSLIHDAKRNPMTPKRAEDLVFVHSNLRVLSRKSPEYLTGETMFWDVAGDAHEPFDGAEQLAIAELSLNEPEFERVVFENDNED